MLLSIFFLKWSLKLHQVTPKIRERPLKNWVDFRFYDFVIFFEKRSLKLQQIILQIGDNGLLPTFILTSREAHFEVISPVFAFRAHLSTLYGGHV
jgi:hypothetical protein